MEDWMLFFFLKLATSAFRKCLVMWGGVDLANFVSTYLSFHGGELTLQGGS